MPGARNHPKNCSISWWLLGQLRTFLQDAKYGGDDPVALPVFTLDTTTPRIKGARWYIQGKMDREVGLFAKDLFPGMGGKIYVEIDDLRIFQFPTNGGEHNNVSAWVDSDTLNVRWMEDKESLSKVQADEKGISHVLSQSLAPT